MANINNLDAVWEQLSVADRHALLGHGAPVLSENDRLELVKALARARKHARRASTS